MEDTIQPVSDSANSQEAESNVVTETSPLEPSAPPLDSEGIATADAVNEEDVPQEVPKPDDNSIPHSAPLANSAVFQIPQPISNVMTGIETRPPTMFGRIPEQCVTFCIDTSGSMYDKLDVVKQHLLETLSFLATREDQMFNLIQFNSQVTQWADRLVECTPQTVAVAQTWVNDLSAKTGTNTQDALVTAFADPKCQAVYLVSDGLPDQYAEEVLDRVVGMCGNRSVHCIYITGEVADEATTEFLEDLAVETFGSFHIVTLTNHGMLDRVTPVYRSDHAHERIVHTVNNTLRQNIKTCSVATTLQIDPEEVLAHSGYYASPFAPYVAANGLVTTLPHRYYYPHYWSRYRPAKAWLQAQDILDNPANQLGLSPAAGSLLVGKKVIARRIDDGYLYKATVQSQNLGEKFLVSFGPCKHGKYREVEYQDTYVFDIVDHHDALRHTIITGDNILAPWEPEGERYCPGIVIQGHEKRQAEGPDDQELTISFSNGTTVTVAKDLAVWIPPSVYERWSLELKMPKEARKTLLTSVDQYPIENLPGYPTSGPRADPTEFYKPDPLVVDANHYIWNPYLYTHPPHLPAYRTYPPFVISRRIRNKQQPDCKERQSDDPQSIIPGTSLTKEELDSRVASQLMEHRITNGQSQEKSQQLESTKLLTKRNQIEENNLKKSVSFNLVESCRHITPRDEEEEKEVEKDCRWHEEDDGMFDEYGNPIRRANQSTNTDSSLLFYRSPGIKGRPRWQYCSKGATAPSVGSSGPFRETAMQAPLEAKDQRQPPYNVEWTSPAFKFVDTYARHDYSTSVADCLNPVPPVLPRQASPSHASACRTFAAMTSEEKEEARRMNRRRRVIRREEAWRERLSNEDDMKACMQDQHRERVAAMMERDRQRQIKEQNDILRAREAKKKISSELRCRIEQNQQNEMEKENIRIAGLRMRRERQERIREVREREIEVTETRRQEIRKKNSESRLKSWTEQLDRQEEKTMVTDKRRQNAKLNRIKHFQDLEQKGQEMKDRRLAVKDQSQAIFMSQILA